MEAILNAVTRQGRGKNEARRVRRGGQVPGVVYGGETREGVPVAVDPSALARILHSESGVNTLIALSVDGNDTSRVMIKECQVDPVNGDLLHVDLYRLAMDRAIEVTVPLVLKGEAAGGKQQGGLVYFVHREVRIECMPAEIPEHIDIDISQLLIGQGIRLRDVSIGVRWKPVSDPDTLLVHVVPPRVEEAPAEAAAPEPAAAEPEVIKKGKTEAGEEQAGS